MDRLKNPKLIAALVLVALAALVFFQNREAIKLKVLVGTLETDLSTALILAFLAGAAAGALAFSRWQTKYQQAKEKTGTSTNV